MKKILLTGATGFLGNRIIDYYKAGYDIYTPSHDVMDITDRDSVYVVIKEFKPDIVLHCAAVSDVGACEREPEISGKINVDGSRNVAECAGTVGAKCLLCSSDQIYFGSKISGPHKESEALVPFNTYGRQKLKAEEECLRVNPESVLLRLSWMYDVVSGQEKKSDFARTLLNKIQDADEILSYPIHDVRGITYVGEVVRNLEKAVNLPGGVYNFGAPNEQNTYETVRELFLAIGWDTDRLQKNETAFLDNPRDISMDQKKINDGGIWFTETQESLIRILSTVKL